MDLTYRYLRNNIRNNLNMGIASASCINFTVPFFAVIAAKFGATNTDYALLNSVPALMTIIATLPASAIIGRFRHQKRIAAGIMLASRLSFLLMALLPLFHFQQVQMLILLVGLYTAANAISTVSWQAIMGELIPIQYRNKVFAQRNIFSNFIGMGVVLLAGWYIDHFSFPYGYQTAYVLGTVCGLLECFYFIRLIVPSEDLPQPAAIGSGDAEEEPLERRATARERLKAFTNTFRFQAGPEFYLFCTAAMIFTFAWMMAWPVFTKIKVDILHATNMQISIDTVASAIGSLIGFRVWLKVADRKGNGLTLFLATLGIACNPIMWLFANSMNEVYVADILGAFVTAGYTQSLFNRQLEILPAPSRQKAIAFYTTLSQISAIFAPILGMQVYEWLSFHGTMYVSSIGRVFGSLCFLVILFPTVQRMLTRNRRLGA
ncbi:MFS transporter [Gorillibacterium timonense]|uniref:MFS transporter n=1 Tax=Gorillibacterium timonense TaxID=1689269 RepID=UPI00071C5B22|nr:MFS transporter [Gorillibacterium timonense]